MRKFWWPVVVAFLTVVPAFGQSASGSAESLEDIRRALQALTERVERLEAENAELRARNQRLQPEGHQVGRVEAPSSAGQSEGGAAGAPEWVSRLSWKGDFRYRHEQVDAEEATDEQKRQRIRARIGVTAKITDTLKGTVRLATTGGNDDPRSTNQTLGDAWDRKGVGIDHAYVDWQALEGVSLQLGKMPLPLVRSGSYFWDADLAPEGVAVKLSRGPFFGTAFGYSLQESGAAADATLLGAQMGLRQTVGGVKLTGVVGYYDVGAVRGRVTTSGNGCVAYGAFFGGPQGNTTVPVNGCPVLLHDFDMYQVLGQAELQFAGRPLVVFADFIRNPGADDLNTGYAAGFTFGKADEPGTWELGYVYQITEKNATFGQFVDSDFAGGITDVDGSVLKIGYAPAKGWLLNGQFYLNDRFVDVGAARDYRRLQLDLNWKF